MIGIVYARYSSSNQREESITAQLRICRKFAEQNGIQVIQDYIDSEKSASDFADKERPAFRQMVSDIASGKIKIDCVIFHKVDRLSRNELDFAILKFECRKKNIKIIYAEQSIPDGPEGILIENLYQGIAQWYSANLSREVKKGMRENALAGKHRGGIPPLGYDVDKETGKYIINEGEAEIVRIIFKLARQETSYQKIADYLNNKKYKSKKGKPFVFNSIHDILRNPKYVGNYVAGKFAKGNTEILELEGAIPAIIEPELWKEVQEIMEKRRRVASRFKPGQQVYLLTGKAFCGECGAAYTGSSRVGGNNGKSKYSVYNCTQKRKKLCDNPNIQKEVLECAVLDKIEELFSEENTDRVIDLVMELNQTNTLESQIESNRLAKELIEIQKKMNNLLDAIEAGMNARIAGNRLNTLNQEKEAYEKRLVELQEKAPVFDREKVRQYITKNQRVLKDRSDMLACKKLIDRYVVKVTLFKDDIIYNFKIPPSKEGKVVSDMVVPRLSVRQTRPPARSETWINKRISY